MIIFRFFKFVLYVSLVLICFTGCDDDNEDIKEDPIVEDPVVSKPVPAKVMFDDFNYDNSSDPKLNSNKWSVRSGSGGPGPSTGSSWSTSNINFIIDPSDESNKLMTLTSSISTVEGIPSQAEIISPLKYFEGTYAARVKFADDPSEGEDGARIVQTFFTISPYSETDPAYSELDFEYLSNGGWGTADSRFWNTSWNTTTVRTSTQTAGSFDGWNDLLLVVHNGTVEYYVNGLKLATHSGIYYPRRKMGIDFNQWFIDTEGPVSTFTEEIDWVFHAKDTVLTIDQVKDRVEKYRSDGVAQYDDVEE